MPNQQFSVLSDGSTSYDVKDATARGDISTLETRIDNLEVGDLANTNISNPQDGQSLVYDAESDEWVNAEGAVKEWVGTTSELAAAVQAGTIEDDTTILVTNDYTPGGRVVTPILMYITSSASSDITVTLPDGVTSIVPAQVSGSTTQWVCNLTDYGTYVIHVELGGSTYNHNFDIEMAGVYSAVFDTVNLVWSDKSHFNFSLLGDVNISNIQDGQVPTYNSSTGKWENADQQGGCNIDDTVIANDKVWSSNKVNTELSARDELSAKNLLPNNYVSSTPVSVVITPQEDGTFTIVGTASSDHNSQVLPSWNYPTDAFNNFIGKSVTLSSGTDDIAVGLFLVDTNNQALLLLNTNGTTTGVIPEGTVKYSIYVELKSGTVYNTTVKPMLRLASIADDTYEPYAETNLQLTQNKLSQSDYAKTGAVNYLENKASTLTVNGITFTVNSDKSVTANGTATDTAEITLNGGSGAILPAKNYRLRGCPANGSSGGYRLFVKLMDNSYITDLGEGANIPSTSAVTYVRIVIYSGKTVNNLTFYPMITETDYTGPYAPYAKTNRELTEDVADINKYNVPNRISASIARYVEWQRAETTATLTLQCPRVRTSMFLMSGNNLAYIYFNGGDAPIVNKLVGFSNLSIVLTSGTLANKGTAVYTISGLITWASNILTEFSAVGEGTNGSYYSDVFSIT